MILNPKTRQSNNVNRENAVTRVENSPIQAGELQKLLFKIFPEFPEARNKKATPDNPESGFNLFSMYCIHTLYKFPQF